MDFDSKSNEHLKEETKMRMKTGKTVAFILALAMVLSVIPSGISQAASAPKVTIKVTYDKVDDANQTETIKLKITNKSEKKLTVLAYQQCHWDDGGEGCWYTYRTKNKKNVTIAAGKTKTVTLLTHQGRIVFSNTNDNVKRWVEPYVKYDGKYYWGQFTANKGLNKKLTNGYFSESTASQYKMLKSSWTD